MERIHARALETENRVRMLETHGLRLQAQQTMLTTISTQATLLLGFALATYGADLLPYILNDDSPFCLYKNGASMVIGFIFLLANTCCICFCMMVLIASSLLVIQSQNAYLLVGGEVAVWRTQQLSSTVFYWYGLALCCFLLDAVLLIWIFLGVPHWLANPNPGINSEDVLLTNGEELLRCIDDTDPKAHESRNAFGLWNAIASTVFFIGFVVYGVQKMREFVHLYTLDELRGGDEVVREEQRKSRERDLRREVELAKMRLGLDVELTGPQLEKCVEVFSRHSRSARIYEVALVKHATIVCGLQKAGTMRGPEGFSLLRGVVARHPNNTLRVHGIGGVGNEIRKDLH